MKLFSIYDKKAETFLNPFTEPTFGVAERKFKDASQDQSTPLSKFKEDFTLQYIGDFDPITGLISAQPIPQIISTLV